MKQTVTRDDVAKFAGVSPATVSNVINNKNNVKEVTRDKVIKAIKKLDYTPNSIARSLMLKSTRHIGLIIDDITNPHFADFAKGAHHEATDAGYILSISLASRDIERTLNDFISRQVDGIIIDEYIEDISDETLRKIQKNNIKLVLCNLKADDNAISLLFDYRKGTKLAFEYLVNRGHKDIALIRGLKKEDYIALDPLCSTFKNSYINTFCEFDEERLVYGKEPYLTNNETGYIYGKELLNRNIPITAIIVGNDFMAIGVLKALSEAGLKVPEDISIITFDNTIFAEANSLTSVYAPVFKIGRKAVDIIVDDNISDINTIYYDMKIKERTSVKPIV